MECTTDLPGTYISQAVLQTNGYGRQTWYDFLALSSTIRG